MRDITKRKIKDKDVILILREVDISNKTFCDFIEDSKEDRHLFLGNGFSIGLDKRFKYDYLFECLKAKTPDSITIKLLDALETVDFEKMISSLYTTQKVMNALKQDFEYKDHIASIKKDFLDIIKSIHPKQESVTHHSESIIKFLQNFKEKIFTTNYDLITYWMHMLDTQKWKMDDGFRKENGRLVYKECGNFFYLHGALHIYTGEYDDTEKAIYDKTNKEDIISQLDKNITDHLYPLIVLEGDSKSKEKVIKSHTYLDYGFKQLKCVKGDLFIHGFAFKEVDKHICEAIFSNSKLKHIYISLLEDDEIKVQNRINELCEKCNSKAVIDFYDADTAFIS